MAGYELAQLNIAELTAPLDSPDLKDFVDNLDRINGLADAAPGFVWRLQTDDGDATALQPLGEGTIVNLSVWQDIASLHNYVYRTAHVEIMRRRREWFARMRDAYLVLWWIDAGRRPTPEEAIARLEQLRTNGPTPEAFTFKHPYPVPGSSPAKTPQNFQEDCPAL